MAPSVVAPGRAIKLKPGEGAGHAELLPCEWEWIPVGTAAQRPYVPCHSSERARADRTTSSHIEPMESSRSVRADETRESGVQSAERRVALSQEGSRGHRHTESARLATLSRA